jgi:hypothetical protein
LIARVSPSRSPSSGRSIAAALEKSTSFAAQATLSAPFARSEASISGEAGTSDEVTRSPGFTAVDEVRTMSSEALTAS